MVRLHTAQTLKNKNYKFRNDVKKELEVLVESEKDGLFHGYDQYFNKILINSDEDLLGNWINICNKLISS